MLFTAFPPAFALIFTSLHVALLLVLLGIVLRGSAFVFRAGSRDASQNMAQWHWGRLFAGASLVTPILLGVVVGAISSSTIRS